MAMRGKPEDWRVRALRVEKRGLSRYAFNLAYIHGTTVEEVVEIATRGFEEGAAARAKWGPPKSMSDD